MKQFSKKALPVLLVLLVMVLAACGGADNAVTNTPAPTTAPAATPMPTEPPVVAPMMDIVDIAVADGRFETLVAAVTAANLVDTLKSDGPFTVFAPTDEAFAALPAGTVESLLADPAGALTQILLYHVVAGKVMAADVVSLSAAATVQGEEIAIKVENGNVYLNDTVQVIITDIEASNGVIHVIDAVLLPPSLTEDTLGTIPEIAAAAGSFTTLLAAVEAAGLAETLSGPGPFTVFAPTDEAFAALPAGTVESLLADPAGALTQILLYHVVAGEVMAGDVVSLSTATTVQGEEIAIKVENGNVYLNDTVQVIITDIEASNGVIHVIDAVLLPPSLTEDALGTIPEIAAAAGSFNTLLAAVEAAGLAETLSGEGPFTVFAPTDEAFAALPAGTVEALLADPTGALTDILLYHVVSGEVLAADVVEANRAITVQGEEIAIRVTPAGVVLNGYAMVVVTDIMASNGVIHVIDAVIIPPSILAATLPTIAEAATEAGSFTTLLAAVEAAGLTEILASPGFYTVFAPTDAAFAALPAGTIPALLADVDALTAILLYHIVDGVIYADEVITLDSLTTLQGDEISIEVTSDGVILNGTVKIITTDIVTSNGIIHVIDAVLLPPSS
ncbi:MAG: fasciclin domain-containing protein [Anaerolineae bacterium]|nr:fasciclin domain-containing protein [Anaerolineae bacterium]